MTQFQEFVTTQYAQGKTIRTLAALTGRSYGTVRSALVAAGVELRPLARRPDKDLRSVRTARSRQEEFSALLLSCRINAGLTGRQAGQRAGMSQSKLSKLENGRLAPKVNEAKSLAEIYRVSPTVKARIIELATTLATDGRRRPAVLRRGESSQHVRIALAEQSASTLHVLAVSGIPDVIRHDVFTNRPVVVLVPEGVVRASQDLAERIRAVSLRSRMDLGVIPFSAQVELPEVGFRVLDTRMVIIELVGSNVVVTDRNDVRQYLEVFAQLRRYAVFGDRMRKLLPACAVLT